MTNIPSDDSHFVLMRCPSCGLVDTTQIRLTTVLKQTREKTQLGVTLAQDPKPHLCHQPPLPNESVPEGQEEIQWG